MKKPLNIISVLTPDTRANAIIREAYQKEGKTTLFSEGEKKRAAYELETAINTLTKARKTILNSI